MTLITVLIVVAILYFARTILIPFSLAILLAFLLGPLVIRLRHWGFGRVTSTLSVVLLAFLIVGSIGAVMGSQMTDLAHKLPEYQQNVHRKLEAFRSSGTGFVTRIARVVSNLTDTLTPRPPTTTNQPPGEKPVPVEIRHSPFSPFEAVQKVFGSLVEILVTIGIVIVFVIFILIERENLRDRLIRLAGFRRINLTTKLLDDTAHRVSRYLLAQAAINIGFGLLAGIGLYFLGVPNPFLWAMLAAVLRYVPYLGIWIAATMPAAVALAVEPGWVKVPVIFGMYFGIDLLMYNFAEPLLYGNSTGISPLAILVAAVFWTWLWGPVGLILATPLTVCVVVMGHHVPNLEFIRILFSDEEVLPPETRFYQRMLALDLEEARDVAEDFLKSCRNLEQLFDRVIVPALTLAEKDRHQGTLDDVRQQFIFQNTRMLVEDIAERADEIVGNASRKHEAAKTDEARFRASKDRENPCVLCLPARDQADEIAAFLLSQLLLKRGIAARALSSGALVSESVAAIERHRPEIVCVAAIPPFGFMHARYLCRRIRSQFQQVKLLCSMLTEQDVNEVKQRQPSIDADEVASSLQQALAQIISLIPEQTNQAGQAAAS